MLQLIVFLILVTTILNKNKAIPIVNKCENTNKYDNNVKINNILTLCCFVSMRLGLILIIIKIDHLFLGILSKARKNLIIPFHSSKENGVYRVNVQVKQSKIEVFSFVKLFLTPGTL